MPSYLLQINDLRLRVSDHTGVWHAAVPANYSPFALDTDDPAAAAAVMTVTDSEPWAIPSEAPLSETANDLGITHLYRRTDGWLVSISPLRGDTPRLMLIDPSFERAELRIAAGDPAGVFVLDSMLRIFFSQYAVMHDALLVHSSAVELDGRAYLFMGRSGTGKSTHTRLWLSTFDGARLINDDVPMVSAAPGSEPLVCGTPWSGKGCVWRRRCVPLKGIARLRQHPANIFTPTSGIDAFITMLPGLSVMTADDALYSRACTTALRLISSPGIVTGTLRCLPDPDAARLALRSLSDICPSR